MSDKFLIGKTIKEIMISQDRESLLFKCEDGDHIVHAVGDCCSYSWVESIDANVLRYPCTVLNVVDLEMPDGREGGNQGWLEFYGLRIVTDAGPIEIEYRNDSNGYYGGYLLWPGEYRPNYAHNDKIVWKSILNKEDLWE